MWAGVAIAAAIFPWLARARRNRIIRDWSRILLVLCGLRLKLAGNALSPQLARSGVEPWSSGRLLLANPDLVERFRRGAPLNAPDYQRLYMGEERGYTDYPLLAD